MGIKTKRNSAIELLRIICMVFIIMRHYSTQVDWGMWTADNYSLNVLFLQLITLGGSTANNVFMLITGYYMISLGGVNYKKIIVLLAELFFYSWLIAVILFGFHIIPFNLKDAIKAAFPIWFGYNWYVCCYIIFCCFVPFLNDYLNSINQKTYFHLMLILLFIWSFAYTFRATTYMGTDFSIDHFVVIYMLGGYIRLHDIRMKYIKNWWKVFGILSTLLFLSVIIFSLGGCILKSNYLIVHAMYFTQATNILDVMVATALFLAVINIQPFFNHKINSIAGSVVGIFLLHHNPLLQLVIWNMISPNAEYFTSPYLALHMLIKVTAVFLICLSIDQLRRRFIEKPFAGWLDKKWEYFTMIGTKIIKHFDNIL